MPAITEESDRLEHKTSSMVKPHQCDLQHSLNKFKNRDNRRSRYDDDKGKLLSNSIM